jgi:hypothetical protein
MTPIPGGEPTNERRYGMRSERFACSGMQRNTKAGCHGERDVLRQSNN